MPSCPPAEPWCQLPLRVSYGVVTALSVVVAAACGGDGATLQVDDPWARASASTQDSGAVYMVLSGGDTGDTLTGARVPTDVAAAAQIHTTRMDDAGVMSMSPVTAVHVPRGGVVTLEPGGIHIMLVGLTGPLADGASFELTLVFENAGEVESTVKVRDE